jgi:hypothetical protein
MNKDMKKQHVIGLLTLLALASCDSHDASDPSTRTAARFVATIQSQADTRAADTSWDANDQIGVSGTSGSTTYTNIAHATAEGDGSFALVKAEDEILFMDEKEVTFSAYYPWTSDISSPLAFTVADLSKQKSFDYLYGTGTGSATSPTVSIAFHHVMSKLVFTLKATEEFTLADLKATKMKIEGLGVSGTFNASTGAVSLADDAATSLDVNDNAPSTEQTDALAYSLILPPQKAADAITLTFTSSGVTFTAQMTLPDENTLLAGTEYAVNVTLYKSAAVVNGCTITAWEKKTMDDLSAEL